MAVVTPPARIGKFAGATLPSAKPSSVFTKPRKPKRKPVVKPAVKPGMTGLINRG